MSRAGWFALGVGSTVAVGVLAAALTDRSGPLLGASVARPFFDLGTASHGPYARAVQGLVREQRVQVQPEGLHAFGVDFFRPPDGDGSPLPVIVYVHGGGFVGGSTKQIEAYCEVLAAHGYLVANVDYTLAPELVFPGQIRQTIALLRQLPELVAPMGGDASRTVIAGDSAGANLAASVAAAVTNGAYAALLGELLPGDGTVPGRTAAPPTQVRAALLMCGPYDIRSQWDVLFPGVNIYMHAYTGRREWWKWDGVEALAPNRWVTERFPPTFLTVGDADPLAKQSLLMEKALNHAGVTTASLYWKFRFLPHEYQRELHRPEAQEALRRTLAFLRCHVPSSAAATTNRRLDPPRDREARELSGKRR